MHERPEPLYKFGFWIILAFCASAIAFVTGCGVTVSDPAELTAISAASSTIRVNQQMQLVTRTPVTFYVDGIEGGNAEVGTVDSKGVYTAPAIVPIPNTVTITSVSSYFSKYPGSLTLSVLNPIPVLSHVTPAGFSEGTTTVDVSGSQFVYGAQILWNGAPIPTTFVSGGELVASIAAPNPGTFPLTVQNPNPGSANANPVSVIVGPGQVVLTLQPGMGTDVRVENQLNIGLSVTGTDNTGVTLQVNGIPGGNSQIGTASLES